MEQLFSDSEVFTNVRPTKITKQQEQKYLEEVAEEIIDNNWSKSPIEKIIYDLKNISSSDNGYEIAKKLEEYNSKASYSIDSSFVEFLDDFDYNKRAILRENIKAWVNAHNPQPKFKEGQKITIESPLFRGQNKGDILFITGKNDKEANYYIHEDKDYNGGYVVAYEEVEKKCIIN